MPEHGGTNSEASDAVGSASAEKPTVDADHDEVTSAPGPYHLPGNASEAGRQAAGVHYWMMEDSPLLEDGELSDAPPAGRPAAGIHHQPTEHRPAAATPGAASWCGQPDHSPPVAGIMPELCHQETPSLDCACGKDATPLVGSCPKAWAIRPSIKGHQMLGSRMKTIKPRLPRKKESLFCL